MAELTIEQVPLCRENSNGPLRTAVSISGGGSNLIRLLERQEQNRREGKFPFEIAMVFTDNRTDSRAVEICQKYKTLLVYNDLRGFCDKRGVSIKDKIARRDFDFQNLKHYMAEGIDLIVQAGYEGYTTESIYGSILTINVHPGDLSKVGPDEKRLYTGLYHKPAEKAILNREKFIRASVHVVNGVIDGGGVLTLSQGLPIQLPVGFDYKDPEQLEREAKRHQNMLKEIGDWVALPFTVEGIGNRDYTIDAKGNYYYKGVLAPVRLGVVA